VVVFISFAGVGCCEGKLFEGGGGDGVVRDGDRDGFAGAVVGYCEGVLGARERGSVELEDGDAGLESMDDVTAITVLELECSNSRGFSRNHLSSSWYFT